MTDRTELRPAPPKSAEYRRIGLGPGDHPHEVISALAGTGSSVLSGRWFGGGLALFPNPLVSTVGPASQVFPLLDVMPAVVAGEQISAATTIGGGWVTSISYDALQDEAVQAHGVADPHVPACRADFHDHVLRWQNGHWWIEQLWTQDRAAALAQFASRASAAISEKSISEQSISQQSTAETSREPARGGGWSIADIALPDGQKHGRAIEQAQRRIAAGDFYLANVCTEVTARFSGDPLAMWAAAAAELQPDYAAYLPTGSAVLAGLSPELFLRVDHDHVSTAPIKGTRRRSADPLLDAGLRHALATSVKDRAENVMIVDLMRNDLGRLATTGSVRVTDLLKVSAHTGVWHLVSSVEARLPAGTTIAELLRATFPPGSVTGAPKDAAVDALHAIESVPRGYYTGTVGAVSALGAAEFAVSIRTFEMRGSLLRLGVGGGITIDSDVEAEFDECLAKAGPLFAAAGFPLPLPTA